MKTDHEEKLKALALLAGIEDSQAYCLQNGYWAESPNPWMLFITDHGHFRMGWRKRVIHIEWTEADAEPITEESLQYITHGDRFTHAYGYAQALLFLSRVVEQLKKKRESAAPVSEPEPVKCGFADPHS